MGLWARSRPPRTLVVAGAGLVLVGPLMERLALALLVFLWGVLEELWLVLQAAVVEVRQAHGALAALGQQEGHLPMPLTQRPIRQVVVVLVEMAALVLLGAAV